MCQTLRAKMHYITLQQLRPQEGKKKKQNMMYIVTEKYTTSMGERGGMLKAEC